MLRIVTGLVMVGVGIATLIIARPHNDEAVGFLRGRSGLADAYIVVVITLLVLGGMLMIPNGN